MDNLAIAVKDFSKTPGSRYRDEGVYSGQEFRENKLEAIFNEAREKNINLVVDLDGTIGYGTSWLEEVFGGLARSFNKTQVLNTLKFTSEEEPYLIDDIKGYIENA